MKLILAPLLSLVIFNVTLVTARAEQQPIDTAEAVSTMRVLARELAPHVKRLEFLLQQLESKVLDKSSPPSEDFPYRGTVLVESMDSLVAEIASETAAVRGLWNRVGQLTKNTFRQRFVDYRLRFAMSIFTTVGLAAFLLMEKDKYPSLTIAYHGVVSFTVSYYLARLMNSPQGSAKKKRRSSRTAWSAFYDELEKNGINSPFLFRSLPVTKLLKRADRLMRCEQALSR